MKIYASRIDDLRRARDEWDAESARLKELRDAEHRNYRTAVSKINDPIEAEVMNHLREFKTLEFTVDADTNDCYGKCRGAEVKVACNQNRIHDENSALSWDYTVALNGDGEVQKKSSSWSGLQACTEANMQSLHETVAALDYLNSVDWSALLDVAYPSYEEYHHTKDNRGQRPNFDQEIFQAELDTYIGTDTLIKGGDLNGGYRSYWYQILRETPKQYEIGWTSNYELSRRQERGDDAESIMRSINSWTQRVRKDRLIDVLDRPLETMTL